MFSVILGFQAILCFRPFQAFRPLGGSLRPIDEAEKSPLMMYICQSERKNDSHFRNICIQNVPQSAKLLLFLHLIQAEKKVDEYSVGSIFRSPKKRKGNEKIRFQLSVLGRVGRFLKKSSLKLCMYLFCIADKDLAFG